MRGPSRRWAASDHTAQQSTHRDPFWFGGHHSLAMFGFDRIICQLCGVAPAHSNRRRRWVHGGHVAAGTPNFGRRLVRQSSCLFTNPHFTIAMSVSVQLVASCRNNATRKPQPFAHNHWGSQSHSGATHNSRTQMKHRAVHLFLYTNGHTPATAIHNTGYSIHKFTHRSRTPTTHAMARQH